MELTVKNLKTLMGRDGIAFTCVVYYGNKKIGLAHDDGNGGEVDFQLHPSNEATRKLVKELEAEIATLPEIDLNEDKGLGDKPMMFQPDLEWMINKAVDRKLAEQDTKKITKQMKQGIMYGRSVDYSALAYWNNLTLETIKAHPKGIEIVQAKIDYIKANLKQGETILNAEYLRSLGWKV